VWINESVKIPTSSPCCNPSNWHEKRFFFADFFWWRKEFSIKENEKNLAQGVEACADNFL
jgi:hypothetical protein